jgi:hypothetical protein
VTGAILAVELFIVGVGKTARRLILEEFRLQGKYQCARKESINALESIDDEKKLCGFRARLRSNRQLGVSIAVEAGEVIITSTLYADPRPRRLVAFRKVTETERFFLHCPAA